MNQEQKRTLRTVSAIGCLLVLAVVIVFGQTAWHEFINFDDDTYAAKNPHVAHGLTVEAVAWSFTTFHGSNWHPLTWLSHAFDCQLYGLQHAGGHHLTNVVLHAAVVVLLLLVLWQMSGNLWPSAFVAAVFAIHPLRVESVAWVAERKDLLSGLFFMLILAAYVRYVRQPFSWRRYLLVAAMFTLGLMAKPMLVTLPFLLLLLDYWPLRRMSGSERPAWRQLIAEKIPLLALAVASCAVTSIAQGKAIATVDAVPISSRLANALVSYVAYIGQFFYPAGLAVFYPYPADGLPTWKIVVAVAVLLSISMAALLAWRRMPYLFVGWFWYVGMLVPVIGLVQVGSQAMADRYTYLPQIGLCIAIAWGAANFAVAWPYRRWAYAIASVAVVVGLMACAWRQTSCWHDSETLWNHTLACTSRNVFAHNNLGVALLRRNQMDAAIDHFQKATGIWPEFDMSYNNLAATLDARGRSEEAIAAYRKAELAPYLAAIAHYRKALEINPKSWFVHHNLGNALAAVDRNDEAVAEYRKSMKFRPDYAEAHNNLANVLGRQGHADEALAEYQKAIDLAPDYADAHNNLGVLLAARGQLDAAIAQFRSALAIQPDAADTHGNLGMALSQKGQIAEAMDHWREAVRLDPNDPRAVNRLAWAMATRPEASIRNGAEAVELAQWAVQLSNNREPVPMNTLAAAYAQTGRFAEATTTAQKAFGLAERQEDRVLADSIKTKIAMYEAHTPFLDTAMPSPPSHGSAERGKGQR
jgi:protein O-mannosyl-transferase